jgi:hypothetical protein
MCKYLDEKEHTRNLNVLLGIFNRRRRTFSHLCKGFSAPLLQREEEFSTIPTTPVSLHLRDVLHFSCAEESADELDEFLRVTVAWGRRSQLEFSFAKDE